MGFVFLIKSNWKYHYKIRCTDNEPVDCWVIQMSPINDQYFHLLFQVKKAAAFFTAAAFRIKSQTNLLFYSTSILN